MKLKLKSKIMIMVLTPIILIGAILTIYSCNKVKQGTYNEVEKKLRAAAVSGLESYDYASNGDYTLDSNGNLKKGDNLTITGDNEIVDNLKKNAGVDATFFYGDERVQTSIVDASGNRVIGTKAQANISKKVLEQGKSFFTTNAIINGKGYFGYYIPIKQPSTGETVGMFFAGESKASINDLLNNMLLQILIVTIAICLLAVILSILFANSLTNALKRTVTTLEQVAGGLLDVTIHKRDLKRKDEIGQIAKATETLKNSLLKMIGHINRSAVVLRDSAISLNETTVQTTLTTEEVEKAIIEISTTAMSQATETQDAMENVISMGNLIEETVKDASYLSDTSKQMDDMSSRAITILEDLNSTNKQTEDAIELIASQTDNTNISVQNIKEATALITSIAEETNLLSLNASIEAARAGEQGRGFAVVANQIQKLAEQSNNSALQIEHIIHELLNESEKSVKTMNEVKNIVKNQSENVTKTKSIFGDVNKDIHIAIEGISNISDRTKKLDEARVKLIDIVQGLSAIAEENAASSEETNAATTVLNSSMQVIENSAKELTQLAKDLSDEIKVFQLENSLIEQKEADMQLSIV